MIDTSTPGSTNLLQEEDGHRRGSLWSLLDELDMQDPELA